MPFEISEFGKPNQKTRIEPSRAVSDAICRIRTYMNLYVSRVLLYANNRLYIGFWLRYVLIRTLHMKAHTRIYNNTCTCKHPSNAYIRIRTHRISVCVCVYVCIVYTIESSYMCLYCLSSLSLSLSGSLLPRARQHVKLF